jgi:hypothetical protein
MRAALDMRRNPETNTPLTPEHGVNDILAVGFTGEGIVVFTDQVFPATKDAASRQPFRLYQRSITVVGINSIRYP